MTIVGIDLGTTNCCVAVLQDGEAVVIPSEEGRTLTPSVLAITPEGERLVGDFAKRQAVTNALGTVAGVKRLMGRTCDAPDIAELLSRLPYEVRRSEQGEARMVLHGRELSPEEVSAALLARMRAVAERHLGEPVKQAVITVPAYFDDRQRRATRDAARIAGLDAVRILNEPTAAALAYGSGREAAELVAVYDLGGGTFDISVLELQAGVFGVRATRGENLLGGDDFDRRIVQWICEGFAEETGIQLDQDRVALQRLSEAAERAKIELSTMHETTINLPFIATDEEGPHHLEFMFTRSELENLVRDLVEKTVALCERCLEDAGVTREELDTVILVGGQTRMPFVQDAVREMFGRIPVRGIHPEEVVATGAAVQAGVLEGTVEDTVLLDVIPLSLGIEVEGGLMSRVIERNTTVPTRATRVFSTAMDDQDMVRIQVLQGEREMAEDNRHLGLFELFGIEPQPRGVPQIEVMFDVDASGMLSVAAMDRTSGRERAVRVSATGGLSPTEIDRLVEDAEQHREADRQRRERSQITNAMASFIHQAKRTLTERRFELDDQSVRDLEAAIWQLERLQADSQIEVADLIAQRNNLVETVREIFS